MDVYLSHRTGGASVCVRFPTSLSKVWEAAGQFGAYIGGPDRVDISDVVCPIQNLRYHIGCANLESKSDIEKLNAIAERVDGMDLREQKTFAGALNVEFDDGRINGLDDVLAIASRLDDYIFLPGITSHQDLGKHLVDTGYLSVSEHLRPYINYVSVGAEYHANFGGAYTEDGYVRRRNQEPALGQDEKAIFRIELQAHNGTQQYRLNLPTTDAWLDTARQKLGIDDFCEVKISNLSCVIPGLAGVLPVDCVNLEDANELACCVQQMQKTDGEVMKYLAALAVENPETFPDALKIAIDIDDYELVPEVAAEYGEYILRQIGVDDEIIVAIDGFMDFAAFGEYHMEEDGVRKTDFGMICRPGNPFPEPQIGPQMC